MLGRYLLGYLPVQAAQGLVGFGSVAVFTRLMAPEDYGSYALALAAMSLTHILIFTWLEAAVARFHARAERRGRMREHLMTAYAVYALIALVAGTALIGLVQILPLDERLKTALAFAVVALLLRAAMQIGMETHRARGDVRRFSALEASYLMLGFMIGVGLILTTDLGAAGIFIGLAVAAGVMLVFDLPVMLNRARGGRRQSVRVAAYAAYGLPVTLSLIFEHLLSVGDRFLIAGFLGQGAVGMYAAGYGLADRLLDIIFIWFGAAVWPMTIRALEQDGKAAARAVAGQAAGLMGLIAFPAAAGLALVAQPLTSVLVGEALREEAARILPWIALSGLMNGMMTYYFHEAFTLTRRTGVMAAIMSASAILNLGLNLVFIPAFGLTGAALATVLVYALALVVCVVTGRRHFALPLPWAEWIKAGSATAIMAAAVLAVPGLPEAWQTLAAKALTGAVVYAISAYVFDIAGCRQWLRDARALIKPAGATT
ncbi:lipopolysaccharide biosynthesis protein [Maricaulis virginensis]|uniref:Polysaccharide biosynthesis protein n=1 Tax=Maricaulis virginensis TaxID=144022 RepID=A0A9W6IJG3_9PROT|nr:polysaccharide biosynthesis C-terminal domain-containing protein [Maricaulis virginensis]GLK51023.1 polysaccharide biosynthesis protein [Maricaulis virginensis]